MWPIAQVETMKQIQDRSLLFWTLILPIIFIILFIEVFGVDGVLRSAVASQTITGMSVFFAAFIIISIVITFVKDREKGFVARLASTPLSPAKFFIGKALPFLVITVGQIVILSAMGILFYGMEINQYFTYFSVIVLFSLMITSWGIAIALFSKTENTGIVMAQVIAMGTALVSGLWMPFDTLPDFLQTMGQFLPQYWAHQGLLSAVPTLPGGEPLWLVSLIIGAYTIAGFILSLFAYRTYLKMARN
ncbi:ABC transporter permease [Bacillus sp. JCM 19041]|uniref:ABC transporter permease n=1 Tax=Bacillus sp. JCM 19041 TaxID=1460637 RepID=UPI0006D1E1DB